MSINFNLNEVTEHPVFRRCATGGSPKSVWRTHRSPVGEIGSRDDELTQSPRQIMPPVATEHSELTIRLPTRAKMVARLVVLRVLPTSVERPQAADAQRNAVSSLSLAASWMPLRVVDEVVLCIGPERAHPVASALAIPGVR